MVNYANSKIYKLVGGGLTYIGSTTRPLSERFYEHKRKTSCSSRVVLDKPDACIVLIENYKCEDKEQLLARERHWIDTVDCVNLYRPMLYEGEKQEYDQQYYEANKEQKTLYNKEYNKANKEQISLQKKEYHEKNKEQRCLKQREYYKANKDKKQNKMSL